MLRSFDKADEFTWELNKKTLGLRGEDWVPLVLRELQIEDRISVNSFLSEWEASLGLLIDQVELMPGAIDLIAYFKKMEIPLAIATSSHAASFSRKRDRHRDFFENFQVFICGDDPELMHGKPAPDIYLMAANQLGVDPAKCLVFEDALSGVLAAKAAGMFCCAVPDERLDRDEFDRNATLVLSSLALFRENYLFTICKRSKEQMSRSDENSPSTSL